MRHASIALGLHFNTFKRYAIKLGCYDPNPPGTGYHGNTNQSRTIPIEDVLAGNQPQYNTYRLKHHLFKLGIKENKCEECNISEWNGKEIQCELDHIDGNNSNHKLENLRILCPNCHSQTPTFRSKKR